MIDFHTHILPNMDDGAADTETALAMLTSLYKQGVSAVVLTPHFVSSEETVASFLKRREASYKSLCDAIISVGIEAPKLYLGAEVYFEKYCTSLDSFAELCINSSSFMLVEPASSSSSWLENQLSHLYFSMGIKPVIAHIERYSNPYYLAELAKNFRGYSHMNYGPFSRILTQKNAFKLLKSGMIDFLCTDCHNNDSRSPDFSKSYALISKKLGSEFIDSLNGNAARFAKELGITL